MEENKKIYLGLDISTTTIGCTLLYDNGTQYGEIIEMTHVSPKVSKKITKDPDEALFIKVEIFREEFLKKYKNIGISKIVIEAPMLNSNNASTCATLLKFNGMISFVCYEELGVKPQYISSYDARKYAFPKLLSIRKYDKNGEPYANTKIISNIKKGNLSLFGNLPWDVEKKGVLHGFVSEIFPHITWLYDKNGELKKENFDATDSYVALLGQMNMDKYGELNPTISNIQINDKVVNFDINYWNEKHNTTIHLI